MAKNQFKFKLKISGFELEVEGSKEDVAAITSSVANQLKGLTTPQVFGDNTETEDVEATDVTPTQLPSPQKKKSSRRKPTSGGSTTSNQKVEAIDFTKNPTKYSTPLMKWTMQQKALWILYVVKNENNINELTITQIVNTFNKHFQQSKVINSGNVGRDLGKVTLGKTALVQENSTKSPKTWYLTSAGDAFVQNLIQESKS